MYMNYVSKVSTHNFIENKILLPFEFTLADLPNCGRCSEAIISREASNYIPPGG